MELNIVNRSCGPCTDCQVMSRLPQSIITHMDDPSSNNPTTKEIIADFYDAVEMYESNVNALRIVLAGLDDPAYSEQEQKGWRGKVPIKGFHLQQSIDRLLLMTNALRVLAQREKLPCPTLDGVAKSLWYKPYDSLPPNPPTEQSLEQAQNEAEMIGAALIVPSPVADVADAQVDEHEMAVHFNSHHRRILREMLTLNAVEPAVKKTQKEIIPNPDDYNNFKREFADLRRKGYLLPSSEDKTTRGRWLSAKGVRSAEWLNAKSELD